VVVNTLDKRKSIEVKRGIAKGKISAKKPQFSKKKRAPQ